VSNLLPVPALDTGLQKVYEGVADAGSIDATMVILANFLLETKEQGIPLLQADFPAWMQQHREISSVLGKSTLD
jgi:hypothetical protein